MFDEKALMAGLSYELLEKLAEENNCQTEIIAYSKKENGIDSLLNASIDILVIPCFDSLSCNTQVEGTISTQCISYNTQVEGTISTKYTYNGIHWLMRQENKKELRAINKWLNNFVKCDEYKLMTDRFSYIRNPYKSSKSQVHTHLSPYDKLIRQYADSINWDWRMLAAVIYQESRFAMNTRSHKGAVGLMQVMPRTASEYGIDDLINPENNIKAGVSHFKSLEKFFNKYHLPREEKIKMILAAYNAGENRIAECIKYTEQKGLDPNYWENIVGLIPEIRNDTISISDSSTIYKFKGDETINYVDNILKIYNSFCN